MKKILTLLLSVSLFSATFAQGNSQHKNHYDKNDQYATASNGRYGNQNDRRFDNNRNVFYKNQHALEIQRINREYNYKVQSIENNRYMKNRQKKLGIRAAQNEKQRQIQVLHENYNGQYHGEYNNGRR